MNLILFIYIIISMIITSVILAPLIPKFNIINFIKKMIKRGQKNNKSPDPILRQAPPQHVGYSMIMSIVDEVSLREWEYAKQSLTINSLDKGINFEAEVKRITNSTISHLSPSMLADLSYYVTNDYLVSYISRETSVRLIDYLNDRSNRNNGFIEQKKK